MSRQKPSPTLVERDFRIEELFFSTTDRRGVITSGNDVFVRVSGYPFSDLMQQPHSKIRHPDMPRAVFKLLWDYLDAGRSIVAYVKNMAADGGFYWVMALVTPLSDGYLSVRFKPSSPLFATVQQFYRDIQAYEQKLLNDGVTRQSALDQSFNKMVEGIQALGFKNYDEFMHSAFKAELRSRANTLKENAQMVEEPPLDGAANNAITEHVAEVFRHCRTLQRIFDDLFQRLEVFERLHETLVSKTGFVARLTKSMLFLSINACIESSRLGTQGSSLGVVADGMGKTSTSISGNVRSLSGGLVTLIDLMNRVVFDIATANLQIEMTANFARELLLNGAASAADNAAFMGKMMAALEAAISMATARVVAALGSLDGDLRQLNGLARDLGNTMQALQFIHLNGRIEAARISQRGGFEVILEDVLENMREATHELGELTAAVKAVTDDMATVRGNEDLMLSTIDRMRREVRMLEADPQAVTV